MVRLIALLLIVLFAGPAMAQGTKISAFPSASALTGAEIYPCDQGGTTKKCTITQATTFTNSLFSGDCTVTAGGVVTCTKTSGSAFGSLATLNTINNSNWSGTALNIANGGTGQVTAAAGFNALSPLTTAGDVLYGGVSGAGTRLAAGTSSQFFVSGSTPSWVTMAGDCTFANPNVTCLKTNGVSFGSLATLNTVNNSNWSGTALAIGNGGTGQTTANAGFNALSPMTTVGDIIYGAASGVATRLANGTTGQFLGANTGAAPTWQTPTVTGAITAWTDFNTTNFYPPFPQRTKLAAGVTGTINQIYCAPALITEKMTLSALTLNVSTLHAGGHFQTAIYKSSGGFPGALVAASASGLTTSTGFVSPALSANKQVGPGGADADSNLWFCMNRDDATAVFSPNDNLFPSSSVQHWAQGSATASHLLTTATNGINCAGANCNGGSSTFGTWPNLTGSTWTDNTAADEPIFFYQPFSIP